MEERASRKYGRIVGHKSPSDAAH